MRIRRSALATVAVLLFASAVRAAALDPVNTSLFGMVIEGVDPVAYVDREGPIAQADRNWPGLRDGD